MSTQSLVKSWFEKWNNGDFQDLPLAGNFKHTSPYGTMNGKQAYMEVVEANKDSFLGNTFEIHDAVYDEHKACVRYTMDSGNHKMEVSEWIYVEDNLITEIVSYYNIGTVSYEQDLS